MDDQTTRFELKMDKADTVKNIITEVLQALEERGYDPVNQLSGYLLSGDPTYITNHNGARGVIRRMERDEILEIILKSYIEDNIK
ncbi:IreB family regulatory phosphoprotein [Fastidiosipila sanguinis]|uniref:IreB family regulatory phosphoprotein n=1 Tax=Fastidiosipila sanguinis TaxID=236753 RepID=A0A2S0KNR3_9FIRM|nr:IreB family regulatory phosphoprotein [Fastidiosipila sanguinis]AVM42658.1 IreB family regulatory phosphoprotein [Fastidiosipila sanguinis]